MPFAPLLLTAGYHRNGDSAHDDAAKRARSIQFQYPLKL